MPLPSIERESRFKLPGAIDMKPEWWQQEGHAQSLPGRQLGYYQILRLLGVGGMGEVYLAEDVRLSRKVALKLLPAEFTLNRERLRRFEQEARAASALNHPNIITIFEIGVIEGIHYIAAEYIDGMTLRQRMSKLMRLDEALDAAIQVGNGLTVAHEVRIIHRDIKPENIMIRHDGYIKLLDFGLAKLNVQHLTGQPHETKDDSSALWRTKTDPGRLMGTVRYMSPEQIRGLDLDGRSDIFTLGVVLYEMVAGHAPFEGETASEVMAAILKEEPAPLARYTRNVPPELDRIVSKALVKNREERYQVVKDLLIDLKSLKLELEVGAKLNRADQAFKREMAELADVQAVRESQLVTRPSLRSYPAAFGEMLEPVGGAVPLNSPFYITRSADPEFRAAIARQDSIVLVKGARQVGKTSLLARGMQQAREAGAQVVLTDLQTLNSACLESVEDLFLTLAGLIADQLDLDLLPHQVWSPHLSPSINFERYLRRVVLIPSASPIVWSVDEVDRLFTCDFGSEVFGLFRSWHNKRALDPQGPWQQLTLVISYATEAHLFITDLNQSPFNVGTRLLLEDFTFEQVDELNRRYGSPLRDKAEVARYFRLVGGHPYLVRRGLYEMALRHFDVAALEAEASYDEGPFGDHLRRLYVSLNQDADLCDAVRGVLQGHPSASTESFYRLRSAGLITGDTVRDIRPRSQLYATYLEKHLL
jgi:serine/threonine protein kinase